MKELDIEKAKSLYSDGLTLRKIAREIGVNYGHLRYRMVQIGIHKVKLKNLSGNRAVCLDCKKRKDLSQFPQIQQCGRYVCVDCHSGRMLKYDLAKRNCTVPSYETMLDEQNGQCAICSSKIGHISKNGKIARLAVDHCHVTGKVRGLLCNRCNRGLGYLENNLEAAIQYLSKHQPEKID